MDLPRGVRVAPVGGSSVNQGWPGKSLIVLTQPHT